MGLRSTSKTTYQPSEGIFRAISCFKLFSNLNGDVQLSPDGHICTKVLSEEATCNSVFGSSLYMSNLKLQTLTVYKESLVTISRNQILKTQQPSKK